jgi:hypothetical protein
MAPGGMNELYAGRLCPARAGLHGGLPESLTAVSITPTLEADKRKCSLAVRFEG